MASVLIWEPPQTPATVLERNVFRHPPVASTHHQRPDTTVPSFNVKPAPLSSQPSTVDTFYLSSSIALRTEQGYGEADNSWVKEADIHPGLIEGFASTAV
jgi:hypothetical protein